MKAQSSSETPKPIFENLFFITKFYFEIISYEKVSDQDFERVKNRRRRVLILIPRN